MNTLTDAEIPIFMARTPCSEKNDRLGWTCGSSWKLDDITMGIRCNDSQLLETLESSLPELGQRCNEKEVGWLASFLRGKESKRKGTRNYHLVYQNWTRAIRTLEFNQALVEFQELCLEFMLNSGKNIAKIFRPGVTVLHQGEGLAFVGETPGDPEWLRLARLLDGHILSYEYLLLGAKGGLYPLPLRRDPGPCAAMSEGPADLRRLYIVSKESGEPRRLTPGEAVLLTLGHTRGLSSVSAHMYTLAEALKDTRAWVIPYGLSIEQLPKD